MKFIQGVDEDLLWTEWNNIRQHEAECSEYSEDGVLLKNSIYGIHGTESPRDDIDQC
jgi:hypothetical protein